MPKVLDHSAGSKLLYPVAVYSLCPGSFLDQLADPSLSRELRDGSSHLSVYSSDVFRTGRSCGFWVENTLDSGHGTSSAARNSMLSGLVGAIGCGVSLQNGSSSDDSGTVSNAAFVSSTVCRRTARSPAWSNFKADCVGECLCHYKRKYCWTLSNPIT